MWWTNQNLDIPRKDPAGKTWHFRVWHDHVNGVQAQRIFFWSEDKKEMGVVDLTEDKVRHVSRLKQMIEKLVSSASYRTRFHRKLDFPIEKNYAAYRPLD